VIDHQLFNKQKNKKPILNLISSN